ncbi:MAG: hypothetical protein IJG87_01780 [Ruminococcus sp.]|nr:hypothetical protein [Ruminococcus sp.]
MSSAKTEKITAEDGKTEKITAYLPKLFPICRFLDPEKGFVCAVRRKIVRKQDDQLQNEQTRASLYNTPCLLSLKTLNFFNNYKQIVVSVIEID